MTLVSAPQAFGQDEALSASSIKTSLPDAEEKSQWISAQLALGTSRTTEQKDDQTSMRWTALSLDLVHAGTGLFANGTGGYTQYWTETNQSVEGAMDNPAVRVGKSWQVPGLDSLKTGISGTLPANDSTRKLTFHHSLGGFVEIEKSLGRWNLVQNFGISTGNYGENFNVYAEDSYEEDAEPVITREARVQHVRRSSTELGFQITDALSVTGTYLLYSTSDFNGVDQVRDLWLAGLTYSFNKTIEASLGYGPGFGMSSVDVYGDQLLNTDSNSKHAYLELGISI